MSFIRKIQTSISLLRIAFNYSTPSSIIKTLVTPRFKQQQVQFLRKPFLFTDQASFLKTTEEIFIKQLYQFQPKGATPIILDCGANIGLSMIYFKTQYPNATVIGYEPDPHTFEALKTNLEAHNFTNLELHQAAVWTHDGTITFVQEGGESSHIHSENDADSLATNNVVCIRLKHILEQYEEIDFLKIDIEGAEVEVIKDSAPLLNKCNNIFVEYHSFEKQPQELTTILNTLTLAGFRYKIQEAYAPKQPFIDKSTHANKMDLQLNIFAYKQL